VFINSSLTNKYRLCHVLIRNSCLDWLIQFRIDRLSLTVAFIVLKPEDLAVKVLVVKQYDFLLGAALFLWQQLMALMGW
jgi:hypothetical protein